MNQLLRVSHLSKSFPGLRALDDVSLEVAQGEVVALLGHNGSGKSTLIKVLAGVYRPDGGSTVEVARDTGMHFIHQDLGLIPALTALENLDLSRPLGRTGGVRPVNRRAERSRASALMREFGADFDLSAPVSHLTPAERSIVAIARALDGWSSPHNILVLDEPTAALHGEEVDKLLGVVRSVADAGAGIIYVSHRLDEVLHLADRLVALREGRVVAAGERGAFDHDDLVTIVAGRVLAQNVPAPAPSEYGDARLVVRDLRTGSVHGLDLTVRAGEIVGVAGLVGSGMDRVAGALFGVTPRRGGEVTVDGVAVRPASPHDAIAAGMGLVPADRRGHGAVATMNARENVTLPRIGPAARAHLHLRLNHRAERQEATRWLVAAGVRPHLPEQLFPLFSGGNQQKIVLAKWLRLEPAVLLLDEPTQGVDVGAKAGIYDLLTRAAAQGTAVLVASSDAKELSTLCHRVVVLDRGVAVGTVTRPELSEDRLVQAVLRGSSGPRTTSDADATAPVGAAP